MSSLRNCFLLLTLLSPSVVQAGNLQLEYLGHIGFPKVPWDQAEYEAGRHFGYAPGVFCFVPERNSFFVVAQRGEELIAEISNPGPGKRARLLSDFVDVTEGTRAATTKRVGHNVEIHALLYDQGRILLSAEKYYNVNGERILTHASFAPNLKKPDFAGWWRVGRHLGQTSAFYMTRLPERYIQDGFWLLTGGSVSWRASSSPGPCAVLAAPGSINSNHPSSGKAVPSKSLLQYQMQRRVEIDYRNATHRRRSNYIGGVEGWMGGCRIGGVVTVGNRLIYFGRQGDGFDYYGTADEYRSLTGLPEPRSGKGYRCGPYKAAMWIYNLDGLFKGDRSVSRVSFPWTLNTTGVNDLRSACVHQDRLYVAEIAAEMFGHEPLPVIHVLRIHQSDSATKKPLDQKSAAK